MSKPMSDETLAEIRQGLEETQTQMRSYQPGDIAKATRFNDVSHFDRIVADTYAFSTVPKLLAEVERLRLDLERTQQDMDMRCEAWMTANECLLVDVRKLDAENAAMREIVEAVATMPPNGILCTSVPVPTEVYTQAGALVRQWRAAETAAPTQEPAPTVVMARWDTREVW